MQGYNACVEKESIVFCIKCGKKFADDNLFCPYCGEPVAASSADEKTTPEKAVRETKASNMDEKVESPAIEKNIPEKNAGPQEGLKSSERAEISEESENHDGAESPGEPESSDEVGNQDGYETVKDAEVYRHTIRCQKCGAEYEDENLFCPNCGEARNIDENSINPDATAIIPPPPETPIYAHEESQYNSQRERDELNYKARAGSVQPERSYDPQTQIYGKMQKSPKRKRRGKVVAIVLIIIVVLTGAGVGGYFLYHKVHDTTKVDLTKFAMEPRFRGYQKEGKVKEIEIDRKKVEDFVDGIEEAEDAKKMDTFLETVTYSATPSKKLDNGDEVTVRASYDKEFAETYKIRVTKIKFKVKVSGLKEPIDIVYKSDYSESYYDFIWPDSDKRIIDQYEEQLMDKDEVQFAINEIYARHGCRFKEEPNKSYFGQKDWYEPYYDDQNLVKSWFNEYERANLKTLVSIRENYADYEKKWEEANHGDYDYY